MKYCKNSSFADKITFVSCIFILNSLFLRLYFRFERGKILFFKKTAFPFRDLIR